MSTKLGTILLVVELGCGDGMCCNTVSDFGFRLRASQAKTLGASSQGLGAFGPSLTLRIIVRVCPIEDGC